MQQKKLCTQNISKRTSIHLEKEIGAKMSGIGSQIETRKIGLRKKPTNYISTLSTAHGNATTICL
jgi:hypothetical protein